MSFDNPEVNFFNLILLLFNWSYDIFCKIIVIIISECLDCGISFLNVY